MHRRQKNNLFAYLQSTSLKLGLNIVAIPTHHGLQLQLKATQLLHRHFFSTSVCNKNSTAYMVVMLTSDNENWYYWYHWNSMWSWGTSISINPSPHWVSEQYQCWHSIQHHYHFWTHRNRREKSFKTNFLSSFKVFIIYWYNQSPFTCVDVVVSFYIQEIIF